MAIVLSTQGLPPGAYAQFIPSTSFPNSVGGLRILALVGTGITNATVNGEIVVKGALDSQDDLQFLASSLPSTIVDQNFYIYNLGVDYQLTGGDVDWNVDAPAIQLGTVAGTSFAIGGQVLQLLVTTNANNGSISTNTESITFSGSALSNTLISGVIAEINAAFSDVQASNDGFDHIKLSTTTEDNTILQIGTGSANVTLGFTAGLSSKSSFEPAQSTKYTLSYQRAKTAADYVPKTFFDLNSVLNEYGPIAMDNNGNVVNSISLAALKAFQNGASEIMGMQIDPSVTPTLVAFQQAIDKLQNVDLNILVCLNPDPNLQAYIKNHVDFMSSLTEQRFRTALIGLAGNPSISTVQGYASGLKDRRVAIVYPPLANVLIANQVNPATADGSWPVDGTYIASAIGGIRINPAFDVAEPLLRKQVSGFASISDVLLRTQKNVLANSGVMIVENQSGVARVRDGLTTDLTTVDSAEYSVTEIIDFTSNTCKNFLEGAFIGVKLLNDTPALMNASLNIILQSLINNKILNNFTNIVVQRNAINPTQIDVSFQIAPIFPVKFVLISFTI